MRLADLCALTKSRQTALLFGGILSAIDHAFGLLVTPGFIIDP